MGVDVDLGGNIKASATCCICVFGWVNDSRSAWGGARVCTFSVVAESECWMAFVWSFGGVAPEVGDAAGVGMYCENNRSSLGG